MNTVEDKLRQLLHDAAPDCAGVTLAAVELGVRRRRRRRLAAVSVAAAAVVVAVVVSLVTVLPGGGDVGGRPTKSPAPTPSTNILPERAKLDAVQFNGITYRLPGKRWRAVARTCIPQMTLTFSVGLPGKCALYEPRTTTAVDLTALYGPQGAQDWPGKRTVWQGQPAWIGRETLYGHPATTLALPWVDAEVTATAPTAQQARALLNNVNVDVHGWTVPTEARSVHLLFANDAERAATVQDPAEVRRLLTDLRDLAPVTNPARACGGSWLPHAALLTVHPTTGTAVTFMASFTNCRLVTAGTGAAAVATQQLLHDVQRLVPKPSR